ncbi:MAG TPA: hypothetical protein VKP30_10420 [Polyangiaceae bacterium]|nr:hypothetical protein [Polyangiaceae bacterium]
MISHWAKGVLAACLMGLFASVAAGCDPEVDTTPKAACGVARNKFTDELTDSQSEALCKWSSSSQGGTRDFTCSEELSGHVSSTRDCMRWASTAHCEVAILDDCIKAINGDPCLIYELDICGPYRSCVLESSDSGSTDSGSTDSGSTESDTEE